MSACATDTWVADRLRLVAAVEAWFVAHRREEFPSAREMGKKLRLSITRVLDLAEDAKAFGELDIIVGGSTFGGYWEHKTEGDKQLEPM